MSRRSSAFNFLTALAAATTMFAQSVTSAAAAIKNPVVGNLGNDAAQASSGATFVTYFVALWRAGINIGAIVVLVFFALGAVDWITSGGDKGKLEAARGKMTQAAIGIIILVSAFTLIGFFSNLVFGNDFNLLKLTFPTPQGGSNTGGGGNGGGGSGTTGCGNIVNGSPEFPANSYQCFSFDPKECKYCNGKTGLFEDAPDKCPATSNCAPRP